ncbi:MFS transporter [Desulfovibrio sp. OttesenSCG-928-F07]|nr:MFS transporter [Desulfovibrio sp. OttesenSCG-928-F07]
MSSLDPIKSKPIYKYLLIQTFLMAIALQGWSAIYNNFAVNVAGLNGEQVGIIQSVREIPGFLSVSLLLLLVLFTEMRLMSLCVIVIGLGVSFAGFFPSFYGIILCTLISSIGFHYAEAISQSLTLQHYSITESPIIIGVLRSVTAAGSFGIGLVLFILAEWVPYSGLFLISGVGCIIGGLWGITRKTIPAAQGMTQRNRFVMKKKYWLFYVMTLLSGARRQIFMVFSALLLIERFGFTLREMTMLFLVNHLINWGLNRFIGKAINSFGERKLLTVKYIVLIAIFAAYAFSDSRIFVTALYIAEQLFFNFTVALRTFFQKVADNADIAPTMALGVTINHVAAVVVPFIGGVLWMYDYRVPFFMGMGFAFCSVIAVQFIDAQIARNKNSG